jgi:uncharacterized protein YbaR (Trm112 family)
MKKEDKIKELKLILSELCEKHYDLINEERDENINLLCEVCGEIYEIEKEIESLKK